MVFVQTTIALHRAVHKLRQGRGIDYREISKKFGVGASKAYEKVNISDTDENLFRLVPVPGHGARIPQPNFR